MNILDQLNNHYGYEAKTTQEFIEDFKEEYEGEDTNAINSLLRFIFSLNI